MNTSEIDCILRRALWEKRNVTYAGVFAADMVPKHITTGYPLCFVANTDPMSKPGEHWVACYATSAKDFEFFDSFGMPPYVYPNLRIANKVTHHNTFTMQALNSTACGHYCVYYICQRARGVPLRSISRQFAMMSLAHRERVVLDYVTQLTRQLSVNRPCVSRCIGSQCCVPRNKVRV
jgi:hypothetical protein